MIHRISTTIFSISYINTLRCIALALPSSASRNYSDAAFIDISTTGLTTKSGYNNIFHSNSSGANNGLGMENMSQQIPLIDPDYPGTAVERLQNVHRRIADLVQTDPPVLNGPWDAVRRKLLWAGGLRDLPNAAPGQVHSVHERFNIFIFFFRKKN